MVAAVAEPVTEVGGGDGGVVRADEGVGAVVAWRGPGPDGLAPGGVGVRQAVGVAGAAVGVCGGKGSERAN